MKTKTSNINMNKFNFLSFFLIIVICSNISSAKITNARLESCAGCALNRLPQVREFAYDDLPKYGIEFKKIHGRLPELIFFDEEDKETERHSLSQMNRAQCNELLTSRGFSMRNEDL